MSEAHLKLESEPYSRSGNIAADGVVSLLGAPSSSRLQVAVRETVQNTWDARLYTELPKYRIHLRTLNSDEVTAMKEFIFRDLPSEVADLEDHPIRKTLDHPPVRVLEIADFGTTGLGGPIDPAVIDDDESTDFVDFLRNIGTPRDTNLGGGTYGYGKSSLFALSKCQTILVDTMTEYRGRETRRLLASRVSKRYRTSNGRSPGRFTGRHWWGVAANGGKHVNPMTGREAAALAKKVGLPPRDGFKKGTSILVLDPDINGDDWEDAENSVVNCILWNFWPKLLAAGDNSPAMDFEVFKDNQPVSIPDPEKKPPLNLFTRAMKNLKSEDTDSCTGIKCLKPKKFLGTLAIEKGFRDPRKRDSDLPDGYFPDPCHHVALMRPAELVVKYLQGPAAPAEDIEWGGVFICDDTPEVESAFAKSEPPAHDDWVPTFIDDKRKRTFVNVALTRIKERIRDQFPPIGPACGQSGEATGSLAGIAEQIGSMLVGQEGSGYGGGSGGELSVRSGNGNGSRPKKIRVKTSFLKLESNDQSRSAVFEVELSGPPDRKVILTADSQIVLEGGATADQVASIQPPEVSGWATPDEESPSTIGPTIETSTQENPTVFHLFVNVPGYTAVSVTVDHKENV